MQKKIYLLMMFQILLFVFAGYAKSAEKTIKVPLSYLCNNEKFYPEEGKRSSYQFYPSSTEMKKSLEKLQEENPDAYVTFNYTVVSNDGWNKVCKVTEIIDGSVTGEGRGNSKTNEKAECSISGGKLLSTITFKNYEQFESKIVKISNLTPFVFENFYESDKDLRICISAGSSFRNGQQGAAELEQVFHILALNRYDIFDENLTINSRADPSADLIFVYYKGNLKLHSGFKLVSEAEKEKNQAAGFGYYTDEEVKQHNEETARQEKELKTQAALKDFRDNFKSIAGIRFDDSLSTVRNKLGSNIASEKLIESKGEYSKYCFYLSGLKYGNEDVYAVCFSFFKNKLYAFIIGYKNSETVRKIVNALEKKYEIRPEEIIIQKDYEKIIKTDCVVIYNQEMNDKAVKYITDLLWEEKNKEEQNLMDSL